MTESLETYAKRVEKLKPKGYSRRSAAYKAWLKEFDKKDSAKVYLDFLNSI